MGGGQPCAPRAGPLGAPSHSGGVPEGLGVPPHAGKRTQLQTRGPLIGYLGGRGGEICQPESVTTSLMLLFFLSRHAY